MLSVDSAIQKILKCIEPLPPIRFPLLKSLGHVLSNDIMAPEPLPFFTNSVMDGYAVSAEDLCPLPRTLKIIDEIPAGKFSLKKIRSGTCARIMTGAPLPEGSDAVVPAEWTEVPMNGHVRILSKVVKGQFVRMKGEEIKAGEKILTRGRILKPADLGLMASLGIKMVSVTPSPSVALITTGSEVITSSKDLKSGQIRNSNLISMTAALSAMAVPIRRARHAKDTFHGIKSALLKCDTDVIITCGGVSVGKYDFVKSAVSECGKLIFWKVAMKPGQPFLFGKVGRSWVFGLPGNPVSALVTFEILVKPALLALRGRKNAIPATEKAVLSHAIEPRSGRQEYIRARVRQTRSGARITPLSWQGSGMLRSLTESNAWIVAPKKPGKFPAGSQVQYIATS